MAAQYLTFENNSFVAGESPVTIDIVSSFGHSQVSVLFSNDGPGDIFIETSSDGGSTFGDIRTVFSGEPFNVKDGGIDQIRITHTGIDSAYRLYIGTGNPVLSVSSSQIPDEIFISDGSYSRVLAAPQFGRNESVGTTREDLWDLGGTWVAPTTARTHQLVSSSASDTGAGAGGQTLRVSGLTSWDTKEISEIITLNGLTNVPTVNQYVIINELIMLTWGATSTNVGTITATADVDGTITACINPDIGITQMAVLGVPSVQKAYLKNYSVSYNKGQGPAISLDFNLLFNPIPNIELTNFIEAHAQHLSPEGNTRVPQVFDPPLRSDGPFILKGAAETSLSTASVSAGFNIVLIDNLV